MFREFLYLNERLVQQFLAQVEGGVFDEETSRTSRSGGGGIKGRIATPIAGVEADGTRGSTSEHERVTRQTPESQFNRLYDHVSADDMVTVSQVDEPSFVDELRRGQLLEIEEATLLAGGFGQVFKLAQKMEELLPLADMFGASDVADARTRQQLKTLGGLANSDGPLAVVALVPGTAGFKVVVDLDRQYILSDVSGSASLVVNVTRVIKPGTSHLIGDPTGGLASHMSRTERRKLVKGFGTAAGRKLGLTSPEVDYPAVIATGVAVYR